MWFLISLKSHLSDTDTGTKITVVDSVDPKRNGRNGPDQHGPSVFGRPISAINFSHRHSLYVERHYPFTMVSRSVTVPATRYVENSLSFFDFPFTVVEATSPYLRTRVV